MKDKAATFEVVAPGTRWPSGDYRSVAVLALSEPFVEARLGTELFRSTESGLGPYSAIGLRLSSGIYIELVFYINSPEPRGFVVRIDSAQNLEMGLEQVHAILGCSQTETLWVENAPA